jgi:Domain of unknown function (DUF4350)/Domain of unknown function (DUF4129)
VSALARGLLAGALSLAATAVALPVSAGDPTSDLREVLADPGFRFCHDEAARLTPEEHAFCPLVGDRSNTCPALPRACKLPPLGRPALDADDADNAAAREREAAAREKERRDKGDAGADERGPDRTPIAVSRAMSGVALVLFVALIVAFVVAIARAVLRLVRRDEELAEAPAPEETAAGAARAEEPTRGQGQVETDVERLLARARAEAARGEHARAIDHAYAALLRRLDGDGIIEIHPSRTNGDYLRALEGRPDLRRAVSAVAADVERAQFGRARPGEPAFRAVLERVMPIVSRGLMALLLVTGLSIELSCTPLRATPTASEGSAAPFGTRALAEVMNQHSVKVRRRKAKLAEAKGSAAILIMPGAEVTEADWASLFTWVEEDGGALVIAGVPLPPLLDLRIERDTETETRVTVEPAGVSFFASRGSAELPPGRRLVQASTGAAPEDDVLLRRGASVVAVRREGGKGTIIVFADGALFTNIGLTVGDNLPLAFTAVYHLTKPPRELEIVDAWNTRGASTPIASVRNAELTPALLQLLLVAALLFAWKGAPFAALRDPPAVPRRAFADHVRALGLAYARARASRHVLGLYASWALERLRERVHRAGRQGLHPLAEAIAVRTGRPESEVMRVLVEAASAREEAAPPSSLHPRGSRRTSRERGDTSADLALIRELCGFLDVTGQATRSAPTYARDRDRDRDRAPAAPDEAESLTETPRSSASASPTPSPPRP